MRRLIHEGLFSDPKFQRKAEETKIPNETRLNNLANVYKSIMTERLAKAVEPLKEFEYGLTGADIDKARSQGLCDSVATLTKKFGTLENACLLAKVPYTKRVGKELKIQNPQTDA